MPIRPENRDRYPDNWGEISLRVRSRAGWRCEYCGVPNGQLGGRTASGTWLKAMPIDCSGRLPHPGTTQWLCDAAGRPHHIAICRIVLTVAHLDHQPENCANENLKALCQRCHNRLDAPMRRAGIVARRHATMNTIDMFEERR